jgi:hypothetical protein
MANYDDLPPGQQARFAITNQGYGEVVRELEELL